MKRTEYMKQVIADYYQVLINLEYSTEEKYEQILFDLGLTMDNSEIINITLFHTNPEFIHSLNTKKILILENYLDIPPMVSDFIKSNYGNFSFVILQNSLYKSYHQSILDRFMIFDLNKI